MFTKKGFTLMEVLVVVLIIGILAGVAGREYKRSVRRAEATEAAMLIAAVRDAMDNYGAEFSHCPSTIEDWGISIAPEALEFFNYTEGESGTCSVKITPKSPDKLHMSITVRASDDGLPNQLNCAGSDCDMLSSFSCKATKDTGLVYSACEAFL